MAMKAWRWLSAFAVVGVLAGGTVPAQTGRTVAVRRVPAAQAGGASPGQVHFTATQFTFTVKGAKQGVLKGEAGAPPGHLNGLALEYEARAPVAANGMVSGKVQHQPVIITRPVGAASPQLFSALTTNEVLPEVVIKLAALVQPNTTGQYTITLKNAVIVGLRQFTGTFGEPGLPLLFEEVSFRFQTITVRHEGAGTESMADW
jgi:type VI secretion system secreted protein Hcp